MGASVLRGESSTAIQDEYTPRGTGGPLVNTLVKTILIISRLVIHSAPATSKLGIV
jgi:hypothetical protein